MDEKENTNQVAEVKNLKETKNFSKTKDVISKNNSKTEIELITAYAQLAFHTLKNSNTDITAKSIKEEVTMFYEKFGNTEVKRLANIIMKDGKTVPNAVIILPRMPRNLYPMKIEILTARIPGADCEIANRSIKSSCAIHFRLVTISFSISGTIAYPPPMVKAPILKKIPNASK